LGGGAGFLIYQFIKVIVAPKTRVDH